MEYEQTMNEDNIPKNNDDNIDLNQEGESGNFIVHDFKTEEFVLVKLTTTKGNSKLYVAKILEIDMISKELTCSFLRKSQKVNNSYLFPDEEDRSIVELTEIVKKLKPEVLRRGQLRFDDVHI